MGRHLDSKPSLGKDVVTIKEAADLGYRRGRWDDAGKFRVRIPRSDIERALRANEKSCGGAIGGVHVLFVTLPVEVRLAT